MAGIGWRGVGRSACVGAALAAGLLTAATASAARLSARPLAQWQRWTRTHAN